ncbi:MAG: hypothetical protein H0V52_01165, partial [Acidimicrobiia bacterium]|nr:hypothetical protein [Acidimicrobiia bacterium]
AEIRTHYPREIGAEVALVIQEAGLDGIGAEVGVVDARARLRRREHGNGTALKLLLSP